jgi:23S rRNA pseudouridine2605 synthase
MTRNHHDSRRTGLARAISKLGYCSRSLACELIRTGRVRLNTQLVRDPEKPVFLPKDRIQVDGFEITRSNKIYLMMNKPRGFVTTAKDEKGRQTIYSLLPDYHHWIAPVGRLDMASEGLLLLTNDSEWGARIALPEAHLDKTYHVQIGTVARQDLVDRLRRGVRTKDRELLSAKRAAILRVGIKNSWLEIILDAGRNRHIRRMLAELEIEVFRLIRVAIGELKLGNLPKGKTRALSEKEVEALSPATCSRKMKIYSRVIG